MGHMQEHRPFQPVRHIDTGLAETGKEFDLDTVHHPPGRRRIAQPQPRRSRLAIEQMILKRYLVRRSGLRKPSRLEWRAPDI